MNGGGGGGSGGGGSGGGGGDSCGSGYGCEDGDDGDDGGGGGGDGCNGVSGCYYLLVDSSSNSFSSTPLHSIPLLPCRYHTRLNYFTQRGN